jgi:hypothetical protein
MFSRLGREILYLSWTLAGTGLVLITLSSSTLKAGIIISCIALATHLIGVAIDHYIDNE